MKTECLIQLFTMSSGYNSYILLLFCFTTSCSLVEAAGIFHKKWWYLIVPLVAALGIVVLLLFWCLRKRCSRQADPDFMKMVSSTSSASCCSQNSTIYEVSRNTPHETYDDTPGSRNALLTTDPCKKNEFDGANGICNYVSPVMLEKELDETSSHRQISLTLPYDVRYSPMAKRSFSETEKKSEFLESAKAELTLHDLKTSAVDFENGGFVIETSSESFTANVMNSVDLISRFKSRTISATSEGDYYDLDDEEVEKSIQNEEHCNSTLQGDNIFTTDLEIPSPFPRSQGLKRPLPEITESLDILMENELYS